MVRTQPGTGSGDVSSAKPLFAWLERASPGADRHGRLPLAGLDRRHHRSAPALLGPNRGQGYVDALLRNPVPQSSPVRLAEVRAGDGFHWGDALIGPLIASGMLLIGLAAARSVVRHRRLYRRVARLSQGSAARP